MVSTTEPATMESRRLLGPGLPTLGFAAAYALAALIGRALPTDGSAVASYWPAAGVALLWLGTVWPHPVRRRLGVVLVVLLTLATLGATGVPPALAAAFSVSTGVQAVVTAWVFAHLRPAGLQLRQRRDAWSLVVSGVIGGAAGAVLLTGSSWLLLGHSPLEQVLTDGLHGIARTTSAVTVAGLVLLIADRTSSRPRTPARWGELLTVDVVSILLFLWLFDLEHMYSLSFLVVAVAVWTATRCSTPVAAANVVVLSVGQALGAIAGKGVLADVPAGDRPMCVQLLVLMLSVLTLMLTLHRDERALLVQSLEQTRRTAERQAELLSTVFETTSDGMSVYAADGSLLMANSAAHGLYPKLPGGVSVEQLAEFVRVLHTDGTPLPAARMPIARALRGERVTSTDMVFDNTLDDWTRTFNVVAHPLPHNEGANWSDGAIVAFRDVTAIRAAAAEVARTRDLYAGILSGATQQLIIATDLDGNIAVFNEGAELMLGYTAAEMTGCSVGHLHDPAEVAARGAELGLPPGMELFTHGLGTAGNHVTRQWTLVRVDGEPRQVALTISWIHDGEGNRTGLLGVGTDVTEQVATQARLADSEQRFRAAFDTAPIGMLQVALGVNSGRILELNATMTGFTGLTPELLGNLDVHAVAPAADRARFAESFAPLLSGEVEQAQFEHRYLQADGGTGWGRTTATRVSPAGVDPYLLCLVEDVTARKQAEEALVHQAMHDGLTGLPNRALLRDRLAHALESGRRADLTVGVLLLDLDGFKAVNDTAGHAAGDELLCEVARRLTAVSRGGDTVARLGGDEFAIVCPDIDHAGLDRFSQRLLAAIGRPVELSTGTFEVGASIGSACTPARQADAGTLDRLLQNSDLAMYSAKRAGKNRAHAYEARDRERLDRAAQLLPQLQAALEGGEFEMFGQPIVNLTTGRVEAVETLLRWRRADGSVLAPAQFLDVLETSTLLPAVGQFVLRASCEMAAQWVRELGEAAPAVHVNVSPEQLGTLAGQVAEALAATGLPASSLVLELTEAHTSKVGDAVQADLVALRERGVRIAIDELGAGCAGLARLADFPVDLLKIDLRFVAGLGRDAGCDAVVRAVLGIGQALNIPVVAEGVENDVQSKLLRRYGATTAQGHLFAQPVPGAELLAWLRPALAG